MSSKKNSITIHNFRGFSQISPADNEKKWAQLEAEIVAILDSNEYNKSLEELYRLVEDLYTERYAPLLYNLQVLIETYLHQKLDLLTFNHAKILKTVDEFWKVFCRHVKTIKNVFLCYDRSPKFFKYNTVQSISLGLFTSIIVLNSTVKKKIVEEMLAEIEAERCERPSQRELIKSITEMLNTLQIYEEIFTASFLDSTEYFYGNEGRNIIKEMDVPQYLSHVNQRIAQEQDRVRSCLNKSTEIPLLDIVYKQLIENHMREILSKGFDELIDKSMYDELVLIYKLFKKINEGTKHLISYFKEYIVRKGTSITDGQNEKNMIQDLLDFKDCLDKIILVSFDNRKEFHECVRVAFKSFINSSHAKAAQLLAKFLDGKLRGKDITDDDLEVILTKVIKLFKHVQGKDVFEAFYKKLLAKRLLLGKSANQDAENSMISKLKDECGSGFTSNIEGMFQDINLSRSINNSFKQKLKNQDSNGFSSDFSVCVLTSSYWPNFPNYDINLPFELLTYQQNFQKFYLGNHSGRKLLWQPSLGYCLLRANFDCGCKELQVSLFQTIVLLLFNTATSISFKEIQEATNLDKAELIRTLLSLVFGKAKILLKIPKTREIGEEDTFTFNSKFTDKLFRVKINQIQLQDSPEDEKETEKNVLVDRQFQIDAAIVRIMKAKKSIKHYMLVRELYKLLDIPVNQSDLKKRIELLIEREYMERDKDNKSTYVYIA